jgi:prolyl-tRNA synthetase
MLAQARQFLTDNITDVSTPEDAIAASKSGFARLPAAALADGGEKKLASDGVTVRCLLTPDGGLPNDRDDADAIAIVGRAY